MFNASEQPVAAASSAVSATEKVSEATSAAKLEPIERPSNVKVIRRLGSSFTPSIKDALAGKVEENKVQVEEQKSTYNEYENFSESFSYDQLALKWKAFLNLIADRPNLVSTLSNTPELVEGNKLILKIGNSVQEEDVRQIKPELISWLRKELRNSGIELSTRLEKIESERMLFSDSEKMQMMMQKNPNLYELKQKFNLDFKD